MIFIMEMEQICHGSFLPMGSFYKVLVNYVSCCQTLALTVSKLVNTDARSDDNDMTDPIHMLLLSCAASFSLLPLSSRFHKMSVERKSRRPLLSLSIMCIHSWLAASACNILSQLTAAQQTQTYLSQCHSAIVDSCSTNTNTLSQLTAAQQTQTYLSQCHSVMVDSCSTNTNIPVTVSQCHS